MTISLQPRTCGTREEEMTSSIVFTEHQVAKIVPTPGRAPESPKRALGNVMIRTSVALLAALVMGVAMFASPRSAEAAGSTTAPDVYACFRWNGVAYARQPVFLQVWNPSQRAWVMRRSGTTNASGCAQFNDIGLNAYYTITAQKVYGYPLCYYWLGEPQLLAYATRRNDALFNLGTTHMTQYVFDVC
jgi:hypothetical protein